MRHENVSPIPGNKPDSTAPDTEQAALAALNTLFPDVGLGIKRNERPCAQALLAEAQAVADLIRVASNKELISSDELPDSAICDASYLVGRMIEASVLIECGDFTPKGVDRNPESQSRTARTPAEIAGEFGRLSVLHTSIADDLIQAMEQQNAQAANILSDACQYATIGFQLYIDPPDPAAIGAGEFVQRQGYDPADGWHLVALATPVEVEAQCWIVGDATANTLQSLAAEMAPRAAR